jgi:hypothetical protein
VALNVVAAIGSGTPGKLRFQYAGTSLFQMEPTLNAFVSSTAGTAALGNATNYFGATYSRHLHGAGTAPTIAVGAGAQLGTTPSAALTAGSDAAGTVTFTTGTTPSAFTANTAVTIATVTFNSAYATAAPRALVVTPAGNTAAALSTGATGVVFYAEASSASTTQFLIRAVSSGTPTLAASTAYPMAYVIVQ